MSQLAGVVAVHEQTEVVVMSNVTVPPAAPTDADGGEYEYAQPFAC